MIVPTLSDVRRINKLEMYDRSSLELITFKKKYAEFYSLRVDERKKLLGVKTQSTVTYLEKSIDAFRIIKSERDGVTKSEILKIVEFTDKQWNKFTKEQNLKFYGRNPNGRWFYEEK